MNTLEFCQLIREGIPKELPMKMKYDLNVNHAPKRRDLLSIEQKKIALKNALRYFPCSTHKELATEFYSELIKYGRIYMYRYRPRYEMYARPLEEYPGKSIHAKAIMLMIQNNLNPKVAQHPHELITYGGNGSVFQNWAQYLLTMQLLSEMTDEQTLIINSGHPLGLFPSDRSAPRVVISNGMMIPNYSKQEDWEVFNALGVTQYGQMTAGSYMYIGPQGIVHGTTITILNAGRKISSEGSLSGKLFVSSGLGGMSGAQPKAAKIAGCLSVCAEINIKAIEIRFKQGWVDEVFNDGEKLVIRLKSAIANKEVVSIAYHGNVVDLWELLLEKEIRVDIGSDQTSLHNPWSGGYYPIGISFEESNELISKNPQLFKKMVQDSLIKHVNAINAHTSNGMYFFDYGNAFLLEASRAGADILDGSGKFIYSSYVQDIMGPICFDYGFGPFRWVCTSGSENDLDLTDRIACDVLKNIRKNAPKEIQKQLDDNILWIEKAKENKLVVGSQARILYADAKGRIAIAKEFNEAIKQGKLGPIVLGRDHHDVSGTDSPFRETSNIYDGSSFTADMAIQNVIGDSFRGATWVSIHNGGGVGWGEVINGGFGLLLDGSNRAEINLSNMLFWDVNNGVARRNWAGNTGAKFTIKQAMNVESNLKVLIPEEADSNMIDEIVYG